MYKIISLVLFVSEIEWTTFIGLVVSSIISLSVSIYLVQKNKKMTDDTILANMKIASKIERNKYSCHFNFEVTETQDEDKLIDPLKNVIIKFTVPNEFDLRKVKSDENHYIRIVNESNNICKIRLDDIVIKSISTNTPLTKVIVNPRTFALLGYKDYIVLWFSSDFDFGNILEIMNQCSIEFSYINQLGDKIYLKSATMIDNILKEFKNESYDEILF